ncbi:MAG: DNA mismatch repair protein MutS [Methylococcales bacterium]|jgi:DNA-nicking Smr family endonuclease|nr:DNA mismatch repair protein MutS [Methylococcales bacterium]MBT7445440.1 DNA mismatch repair protein MutS [Methylococcales bacterium]
MNDDNDSALFKDSMKGVTPLKDDGKILSQKNRPKPFKLNLEYAESTIQDNLSDFQRTELVDSDERLSFKRSGVQHRQFQQLQRGQFPLEADLDLHGMVAQDAKIMMLQFLDWAVEERLRTICIIHGKGYGSSEYPVLKNKLNNWLRQSHHVIAFCSAQPKDGGSGALYVRLKSNGFT